MRKVVAVAMLVGMLAFSGMALAQTPAEQQYGSEPPAAGTQTESTQVKPGVFTPPAAESTDDGLLPFTGAALVVPALIGASMLGLGLFVVYRTRRRGN
jgi:LPXTG-motif cell wall-anchored protein